MTFRPPITRDEMRAAIQAMHLALPKFALTDDTMASVVDIYREALLPLDREAVQGGATLGRKAWEKFPSPAAWLASARTWAKFNRPQVDWKGEVTAAGEDVVCRVCKSVPRWAWLSRTLDPVLSAKIDQTGQSPTAEFQRRIAPCNPDRHASGDAMTPTPENFSSWV